MKLRFNATRVVSRQVTCMLRYIWGRFNAQCFGLLERFNAIRRVNVVHTRHIKKKKHFLRVFLRRHDSVFV